jgi:hypothetical protein
MAVANAGSGGTQNSAFLGLSGELRGYGGARVIYVPERLLNIVVMPTSIDEGASPPVPLSAWPKAGGEASSSTAPSRA